MCSDETSYKLIWFINSKTETLKRKNFLSKECIHAYSFFRHDYLRQNLFYSYNISSYISINIEFFFYSIFM
jgi:hypothetical protein